MVALSAVLGALLVSAPAAMAQGNPGPRHALSVLRTGAAARPATAAGPTAAAAAIPMAYGGGPVMTDPRVYLSFWGPDWGSGFSSGGYTSAQAQAYLTGYFTGVGGTPSLDSVKEYCQGIATGSTSCPTGAPVGGNPAGLLHGTWADPTPIPTTPTDPDVQAAARRAFSHWGDTSGVYVVVAPSQHSETGFGTNWCAWHSGDVVAGRQFAYAYLPYIPDAGTACGANYVNPTNDGFGHGYFDGYSIVASHEYAESVTDPFPNSGWIDASGNENGDKCAWGLGSANGGSGSQNISAGSQTYAVQALWSNRSATCVLSDAAPVPLVPGPYVPLSAPLRIFDTRYGRGGHPGRLGPNETASVQVAGFGADGIGVPSSGLGAAVVNVTVTAASAGSYLTLFPKGGSVPTASNLNFGPDRQLANLATVALSADGYLSVYNRLGTVDVILDLEGYFTTASNPAHAGLFNPLSAPTRILDTRLSGGRLGSGSSIHLQVTGGASGVPAASEAVALNLTAVCSTSESYLAVLPQDDPQLSDPMFSNVNFPACTNTPNRAFARLSPTGGITIFNSVGTVDVVVDLTGWFTDASNANATGYNFTALPPTRLLDTRSGAGPVGAQTAITVTIPYPLATAVLINVTGVAPTAATVLTVYPRSTIGAAPPSTSDLNVNPGANVANLCLPAVGTGQMVEVWNDSGLANVVVDLAGYFS